MGDEQIHQLLEEADELDGKNSDWMGFKEHDTEFVLKSGRAPLDPRSIYQADKELKF